MPINNYTPQIILPHPHMKEQLKKTRQSFDTILIIDIVYYRILLIEFFYDRDISTTLFFGDS
tara:strand:- start:842 stop:1027 length:186 start_codon:yes stop_codon:yes gene_type:complete